MKDILDEQQRLTRLGLRHVARFTTVAYIPVEAGDSVDIDPGWTLPSDKANARRGRPGRHPHLSSA